MKSHYFTILFIELKAGEETNSLTLDDICNVHGIEEVSQILMEINMRVLWNYITHSDELALQTQCNWQKIRRKETKKGQNQKFDSYV